jgi:hypothetical protein
MKETKSRTQAIIFFLCAWAIPGLGHFLQKKIKKGIIFLSGIVVLLSLGLVMQGQIGLLYDLQPLTLIKFLGSIGNGIFFIILKLAGFGAGNAKAVTFDYGTAYLVASGFMNFLVAINAYEQARGVKHV